METEQHELLFVDESGTVLYRHSNMENDHEIDVKSVVGMCEVLPNPEPDLVFPSMVMGEYTVDVASCRNILCVSILKKSTIRMEKNSPMYALFPLLALSLKASLGHREIDFEDLNIPSNPMEKISEICEVLVADDSTEYCAFMGEGGEVYGTFGQCSRSPSEYKELMVAATDLVQVIQNTQYVTCPEHPGLIGFDFLPLIKVVAIAKPDGPQYESEEVRKQLAAKVVLMLHLVVQFFAKTTE